MKTLFLVGLLACITLAAPDADTQLHIMADADGKPYLYANSKVPQRLRVLVTAPDETVKPPKDLQAWATVDKTNSTIVNITSYTNYEYIEDISSLLTRGTQAETVDVHVSSSTDKIDVVTTVYIPVLDMPNGTMTSGITEKACGVDFDITCPYTYPPLDAACIMLKSAGNNHTVFQLDFTASAPDKDDRVQMKLNETWTPDRQDNSTELNSINCACKFQDQIVGLSEKLEFTNYRFATYSQNPMFGIDWKATNISVDAPIKGRLVGGCNDTSYYSSIEVKCTNKTGSVTVSGDGGDVWTIDEGNKTIEAKNINATYLENLVRETCADSGAGAILPLAVVVAMTTLLNILK